jgi:hypothetical protein
MHCPLCKREVALNEYDVCDECYTRLREGRRSIDLFRTENCNPFGDHVRLMARMARRDEEIMAERVSG